MKLIKNPKYYPLTSALLAALLYLLIFAFAGILGFDNLTVLSGDLYQQYVAFIQLFMDVLRGKGDFWYSFSLYLGQPTASTFAYYSICCI